MNLIKLILIYLRLFFGIRLNEDSNEETDTNEIINYDLDEIINILPEKYFSDNEELFENELINKEFIKVIDMDYKKVYKRTYNDLDRFKLLYDLNNNTI